MNEEEEESGKKKLAGTRQRCKVAAFSSSGLKRSRKGEKTCVGTYGVVLTGLTAAVSDGDAGPAMKKLWSYMLR